MIFYVSFADETGFMGGVFVSVENPEDVISACWLSGTNPGGSAAIVGPIEDDDFIRRMPSNVELFRLYSKEEINQMA